MAKRRKTTKRRSSRRSVGALKSGNMLMSIGGVLAGVVAAGYINKLALKNQSSTIQSIVPIAAGIALPMFVKSELGKFAGAGMIAYGGSKFLASAGLGAMEDDMSVTISGDDLSVIAGDDNFAMAGDDNFAMAGDYGDSGISVLAGTDDSDLIQMSAFDEEEA
jgi:hypothetical protein